MKKKIVFLAILSAILLQLPSFSAEISAFGGKATIDSSAISTGANVTIPDASTCKVSVDQSVNGAILNWTKLSVPKNNTLNFEFAKSNQYALNKVTSGISEFSGNVTSNGGTVIFSNPNGIVCHDGAVFNVGSLLLTTHDVLNKDITVDDNGKVEMLFNTKAAEGKYKYNGVLVQSATMNLSGNLTIASLGIDLNGANITAKDTVLVTSNGLNYVAVPSEATTERAVSTADAVVKPEEVYFHDGVKNYSCAAGPKADIRVANSIIKTSDGKILLTSTREDGNVKIDNSQFGGVGYENSDVVINSNGDVNINSIAKVNPTCDDDYKGVFYGDLTINTPSSVYLSAENGHTVLLNKNLYINADKDVQTDSDLLGYVELTNVRAKDLANQSAIIKGIDVTVQNAGIADDVVILINTALDKVLISATTDVNLLQTYIASDSTISAGNDINILGSIIGENATKTFSFDAQNILIDDLVKGANEWESVATVIYANLLASAKDSISISSDSYKYIDFSSPATLTAPNIDINNYAFRDTTINGVSNLNMKDSDVYGNLVINPSNNAVGNLDNLYVTGNLTTNNFDIISLTNSEIVNNYEANNVNSLTMKNDIIGGNFIAKNINILDMDTNEIKNNMYLDNINIWKMENTDVTNDIIANNIGQYISETDNNTYQNGKHYAYVQPVASELSQQELNSVTAYVTSMSPGEAIASNPGSGAFNVKAFAAAEDEDDKDYKEEFLTRYVKEDKEGNLFTIQTFKGE